jgi:hypothetical protein
MAHNFVIKEPSMANSQVCHEDIIMFPRLMQSFGHHNVKDQRDVTVWLAT